MPLLWFMRWIQARPRPCAWIRPCNHQDCSDPPSDPGHLHSIWSKSSFHRTMGTIIKAAAAYLVLLLLLRITGRRTGKRMATFEILLIFLLGGQMTQTIIGEDRSFTNALTGVSTIALCHAFV